jgi:hypothetical protein
MTFNQIDKNDLIIVLKPIMRNTVNDDDVDTDGWSGEIQVKLFADLDKSTLNKYELSVMGKIGSLLAAAIPAMNENAFVKYLVSQYVGMTDIELEHIDIVKHKEEKTKGEVIKLTFDSETEGNA